MLLDLPVRKVVRLHDFDYSQDGWYFVTICTQDRQKILGKIVDGMMYLSPFGHVVNRVIIEIPHHYPNWSIDIFQIMPNHVHCLFGVHINGRTQGSAPTLSLPTLIQRFKTLTTHEYVNGINEYKWSKFDRKLWQRNYYEHIIRDDHDLNRIREYIRNNPTNWHCDKSHSL